MNAGSFEEKEPKSKSDEKGGHREIAPVPKEPSLSSVCSISFSMLVFHIHLTNTRFAFAVDLVPGTQGSGVV